MDLTAPMTERADMLAQEIRAASAEKRLSLQPEFDRIVRELGNSGAAVPVNIRDLHEQLLDEAIEARFDNLPV